MLAIKNECLSRVSRMKELGDMRAHHFVVVGSLARVGIDKIGSDHLAVQRWLVMTSLMVGLPLSMLFSSCLDRMLSRDRVRGMSDHANDGVLVLAEKHDVVERVLYFFYHRPQSELGQVASL